MNLYFLPWIRRGLAQHIATPQSLDPTAMSPDTLVTPFLELNGTKLQSPAPPSASIRGPGHVVGIHRRAIHRVVPPPGTPDFEPAFVPYLELAAPDLPWMFTPAAPLAGNSTKLMPWFALIVIEDGPDVTLQEDADAKLPVLNITAGGGDALWDLSTAWAWAHVQAQIAPDPTSGTIDADMVESAVLDGTKEVIARVVCPRILEEDTAYIACLVPTFDAGVKAGLGEEWSETTLDYAWVMDGQGHGPDQARLPVYYSWRFRTGALGSFKILAERLSTKSDQLQLGLRDIDVSLPGGDIPAYPVPVLLSFEGIMADGGTPAAWPPVPDPSPDPTLDPYEDVYKGALAADSTE